MDDWISGMSRFRCSPTFDITNTKEDQRAACISTDHTSGYNTYLKSFSPEGRASFESNSKASSALENRSSLGQGSWTAGPTNVQQKRGL
jgi:hypothetical protein